MKMTFNEYIVNPMGIKNSVYTNRFIYRELYEKKLNTILVREVGKVDYTIYKDSKNKKYYIHMKIPSEVIKKFYYDTVIEFYTDDTSKQLKQYYVRFFSNDPAFVFTFCHSFIKNDIFIKELSPKMSKQAIKKNADIKNPKNEVGYVKSIFFAYLLLNQYSIYSKAVFDNYSQEFNLKKLLNNIEHADIKVEKRQYEQQKLNDTKRKNKKKEKNTNQNKRPNTNNTKTVNKTKVSSSIKRTPTTSKVKSSNIKKTKKARRI